jgi:hypothetical protein
MIHHVNVPPPYSSPIRSPFNICAGFPFEYHENPNYKFQSVRAMYGTAPCLLWKLYEIHIYNVVRMKHILYVKARGTITTVLQVFNVL